MMVVKFLRFSGRSRNIVDFRLVFLLEKTFGSYMPWPLQELFRMAVVAFFATITQGVYNLFVDCLHSIEHHVPQILTYVTHRSNCLKIFGRRAEFFEVCWTDGSGYIVFGKSTF
jgi:hypothetical protein